MIVYEVLFNPDIHESAFATMSIHKTQKGAEMALAFHKEETRKEYLEAFGDDDCWTKGYAWDVRESELLE